MGTNGTLFGRSFWKRGYCAGTVGLDAAVIREYVRNQEKKDKQLDRQGELDINHWAPFRGLPHTTGSAGGC